MADKGQQTEPATPRRIEKARREGQFLTARHFVSAAQFVALVAALAAWGGGWFYGARQNVRQLLGQAFRPEMSAPELARLCSDAVWHTFAPLLAAGTVLLLSTLAVQLAITRMGVSLKKLAPDPKRLSPLARLRELPRQNIPAFVQAAVMLPLFAAAVYFIVKNNLAAYFLLPLSDVRAGTRQVSASLMELLWKSSGVFLAFGCVDLFRQRRRYQQDLRMSKQDIRDEFKEVEGDPHIKMRIRRIRRDLLRHRMMADIPKATAVIVNPTHFAVALRYQLNSMAAPVVIAKGKNYLALRIRQRALEHQVPLVENPPLAQALYKAVDVGQEIPAHLYRAVAEILAYIYRLMNGRLPA